MLKLVITGFVGTKLKDGESGYDFVGKYVERYWKRRTCNDVLVAIEKSYNNIQWDYGVQIASPMNNCRDIEWLNDWWEGEPYIRIYGINDVDDVDVHGGLFEEVDNG